jgi:hypothetical protein
MDEGLEMVQALIRQQVSAELAEARQWPGFREAEPAMQEVLEADEGLTLREAYELVVGGWRLTPDGFVR